MESRRDGKWDVSPRFSISPPIRPDMKNFPPRQRHQPAVIDSMYDKIIAKEINHIFLVNKVTMKRESECREYGRRKIVI
jgi:hypothetical protein